MRNKLGLAYMNNIRCYFLLYCIWNSQFSIKKTKIGEHYSFIMNLNYVNWSVVGKSVKYKNPASQRCLLKINKKKSHISHTNYVYYSMEINELWNKCNKVDTIQFEKLTYPT